MVMSRTSHSHENLAYFYWLQSLCLEKQLALGPQIFQMLDSLNHLSFTTQAVPQMNLLFVRYSCSPQIQPNPEEELTRLHVALYWLLTIALYAVICTHYNDISMRRGSCQWEVMFVQPIVTQDFVPFGHTLTFTLSFSIAKKFKAFPKIWLL